MYLFLILIISGLIIMKRNQKNQNIYKTAYDLGLNYLNSLDLKPNYAVMFDIDDTLINSRNYRPIKHIVNLIKKCNELNLIVLIITARDSRYTRETAEDLAQIKLYPSFNKENLILPENSLFYDYLYLRHSPQEDHDYFKSHVKQRLFERDNIATVMSVGDNVIDVVGDYSGYALKLPNHRDPKLYHKDYYGNITQVI